MAEQLHIDHYVAETLPGQKAEIVAALRKEGKKVCFIGDGINDAPALKEADVSVSLRGATSAAVDTAQVILMDGSLSNIIELLDASQDFAAAQEKNLLITTVPAVICIGGVFAFHFGFYTSMLLFFSGLGGGIWNAGRVKEDSAC